MWNLQKGVQFLPSTTIRQLQKIYKQETKAKPKMRLLAAIHRKKGKSLDGIAYHVNASRNTVHGWLRNFSLRGIQAKDSIKQTGRPVSMTPAKRKQLIKDLERGPPHNASGLWTTKEVMHLLGRKYKQKYAKQHVWRLLVSLGFSLQRPRKQHYLSPSEEELAQFKKKPGDRQDITGERGLLWARRMKRPMV